MLSILVGEGYEISNRDLTVLRQSLSLRMRQANTTQKSGTLQGILPQPTHEDLVRYQRRCEESNERLILGTRRVRSKPWHGIPADEPDLQPRFPSEKTISACKSDLGLRDNRRLYIHMRDTFQRICTEAGISKKSRDTAKWEQVKLALLDAVPALNQAYSSQGSRPPKGSRLWFALDIICSDVAKKIRVLDTRLNIKEVKKLLQLDPFQTAKFRNDFKKLLRSIRFTSRLDVTPDVWKRLEKTIYAQSPYLHAALPGELLGSDDKRAKAFAYMCRDISKRFNDKRSRGRNLIQDNEIVATPLEPSYDELLPATPASLSNGTPRAPQALMARPSTVDSTFAKPSLHYTPDGFAAIRVSFDSDSSGANQYYTPENSWSFDDERPAASISPITSYSSNSFGGDANGNIASATADYCTGSFGPYYLSANDWATKNQHTIPYENGGFSNYVGAFGDTHEYKPTQFGHHHTPSVIPTMESGPYTMPILEAQNDYFGRWGHLSVIPTMENYGHGEFLHGDHQDFHRQLEFETPSVIPAVEYGFPSMLFTEDHDGFADPSGPQKRVSTAGNNLLDMPGMDDLDEFLTRFAARPVAPPDESDISKMQIMQSIEAEEELDRSQDLHGAPCKYEDVSNSGGDFSWMGTDECVGELIGEADAPYTMESDYPGYTMGNEYPDPTDFEI